MPQKLKLDSESFGPLSFPVFYGQRLYNAWTGDNVQLVASLLGTWIVVSSLMKLVLAVRSALRPSTLQTYCHSQTGSWALVTGASDGLGRGFVDELLERGFNVLLHGRNHEKLKRITAELAHQYPRRTVDFVVADASRHDHPETAVIEKVKHLPGRLTILVNNVGGITTKPTFVAIDELSAGDVDIQINLNDRFPTQIIRGLLPTLRKNQPSVILNCGSAAPLAGVPYIAVLSATKAYIHTLTTALQSELIADSLTQEKRSGVEIQGYIVGSTRSAQNTTEIPFFMLSARECARGCLSKVGSGRALEFPHWKHAMLSLLINLIPESILRNTMTKEMKARNLEQMKGE
ncbi:hypothetical protein LTR08_005369 [Meristemomyces frigidus]|nr:hypothetical protein LTR08_005369 [Meristemomyces frigidus]